MQTFHRRAAVLSAIFLLSLSAMPSLLAQDAASSSAQASAREIFQQYKVPGMAVAVSHDGQLVWSAQFGSADLELGVPVGPHTKFRVGSISKLFTVAALAKLLEAGKIDLDASVRKYVPYFPEKEYDFKVRQLASHTAGIRHYKATDPLICPRSYASVKDGIAIFQDDPLLFEPGTQYSYSSYGYNLLSAAIEGASGSDFPSFLEAAVLKPLNLGDSALDNNGAIVPNRTSFYGVDPKTGAVSNARCVDNSYKWASGGVLSSAADLTRLCDAFARPGFLRQETIERVFEPQPNAEQGSFKVGLGWRVSLDLDDHGRTYYHHGGAIEGGRAYILIYPAEGVSVAIVANAYARIGFEEAAQLAKPWLQE